MRNLENLIINPGRKKCFIFDLDGTIIFDNQSLSPDNEKLLRLIHDAGHELVFATARPYRDFKMLMPVWTHACLLVLFGGGLVLKNGEIIQRTHISKHASVGLVEFCLQGQHPFIIDDHENYYHPGHGHDFYPYIDSVMGDYRIKNLDKILENDIFKIFILDDSTLNQFIHKINTYDLSFKLHSKYDSFDILPKGVDKYSGVSPFLEYAVEDTFVFGDDLNDCELFTNFKNTILIGEHPKLLPLANMVIPDDNLRQINFAKLVQTIITTTSRSL